MVEGRGRHTCRVLSTCCVLCCCLLVHQGCSAQSLPVEDSKEPVAELLKKYGDGSVITHDGLESLFKDLKIHHHHHNDKQSNTSKDHDSQATLPACKVEQRLSRQSLASACPSLLLQAVDPSYCSKKHDHEHETLPGYVWMYAVASIVVISACGLLAVAVIPVMQKMFYQQMIQFLVSLAVGTLCGDALLHLIPHAMSGGHNHDIESRKNVWRGFVGLVGILLFFFMERCLTVVSEWRRRNLKKKKKQIVPKVKVMNDSEQMQGNSVVGEKLCKHKYSSYPYCYEEITGKANAEVGEKKAEQSEPLAEVNEKNETQSPVLMVGQDAKLEERQADDEESCTVIVREHARQHHGHSHSHGHVHSAPSSLSSVAWMVIMGDGLHNLTDGMAIGAAFARGLTGGFSTATAVFCHELPHELGDFAVLLKAGMSAKEAIYYNLLSSFLCFIGMIIGITVGHTEDAAEWIYAAAAGTFLYIALVDMIPELTNGHTSGSWMQTLILQLCGMSLGVGIMMLIAFYEENLHNLFND